MANGFSKSDETKGKVVRSHAIPRGRMALLFSVMLVTAAGNTAMQSVMPSIGTQLGVNDVWISLATLVHSFG